MEYKVYNCDSYNIYTIKTDKFKNCYVELIYRNKLVKDEITKRSVLIDMLTHSCGKYPSKKDFQIELEELYNAYIYGTHSRVGETVITTYALSFLNPKYTEKKLEEKALKLLFNIIEEPNIENSSFNEEILGVVKNSLRAEIIDEKSNTEGYAIRGMLKAMDETSMVNYKMSGNLDDLAKIDGKNLVEIYKQVIKEDLCDIFVVGNLDMDNIAKIINRNFKNRTIKNINSKIDLNLKTTKKIKTKRETEPTFTHSHLVFGCNINKLTEREKHCVIYLYNSILGSSGLDSKLYQNLRETNSLCYNVKSLYNKHDNLLVISTAIDKENEKLATKLIKDSLKEMTSGHISKEEIESAKKQIVSSLKMAYDSPAALISHYLFSLIDNLPDIKTRINELNTVTKKEIVEVAKKIKINTIYFLKGGNE